MTAPPALRALHAGLSRRSFLQGAFALGAVLLLGPRQVRAAGASRGLDEVTRKATRESPLIYVSPLRRDGSESRCHAEIWFARDPGAEGDALMVVTPPERWRSEAVKRGLDRARIWVGDHGVWTSSGGRFRSAPSFLAKASVLDKDDPAVARVLEAMASKYADSGWSKWGPRFHDGIADGSRVMIRYVPADA